MHRDFCLTMQSRQCQLAYQRYLVRPKAASSWGVMQLLAPPSLSDMVFLFICSVQGTKAQGHALQCQWLQLVSTYLAFAGRW